MSVTGLRSQRKRGGALAAACRYALIALFAITPALGREISDAEIGALKAAISELSADIKENNVRGQVARIPPRLAELYAKKGGITVEALREQMIASFEKSMGMTMGMVKFEFDCDRPEFGALPSGEPYALILCTKKIVFKSLPETTAVKDKWSLPKTTAVKDKWLALIENGKWYLVQVGYAALIREAYPEFAQVGLPEGTMEIMKNEP
jgi:hypothetical protein